MKKAYIQFSKRIAMGIFIFWALYRIGALVLSGFRPELAPGMVGMISGVDDVMMVSIGFYTGNSVIEKGIIGYFGAKKPQEEKDTEDDNG